MGYVAHMEVGQRIAASRAVLTKAERRVAEVVLQRPHTVAFGTVAELASQAGAGAATVVRLAAKLGFDGFTGLQAAVQSELEGRLRPAAERIRQARGDDVVERALPQEVGNVHETLEAVDRADLAVTLGLLADPVRRIRVVSGEATRGVAIQAVGMLAGLRPEVELLDGNPVAVAAALARTGPGDVLVAIDVRRYEGWVVQVCDTFAARDGVVVALTDSRLSPLAAAATACFVVAAEGSGPFDSHVGTLALLNLFTTGVAEALRDVATNRLDAIEQSWRSAGVLLEP